MSFSTVAYFLFLIIGIVVYYVIPRKYQWIWLLIMSYGYYFTFDVKTSLFMVYATVTIYVCGLVLDNIRVKSDTYLKNNKETLTKEEKKKYKESVKRKKRLVLTAGVILDFGMLAVMKYTNFAIENLNSIITRLGGEPIALVKWVLPIGISFFTFQAVSYIVDVYQGKYEAQKNPFKLGLFVSFFPQIMQGPIGRYDKLMPQFLEGRKFNLINVQFGLQRIGWGLAKKMILADRAAVVVMEVFQHYEMYSGLHYILGVLMYTIQLYMDFSGGIDIVIGSAEMFGITMDENFRQPFFSKSIGEFWRRWHISLGAWMKDYIFYPMSLSKAMNKFGKWGKKHIGNTVGKTLPICFANMVIFFIVGIWHGPAWKFIIYGIYNGFIIAVSNLLEPVYKKGLEKCHINGDGKAWTAFKVFRTFVLVVIGFYFDMSNSVSQALCMIKWSIIGIRPTQFNLRDTLAIGLDVKDYVIILMGCIVILIVSIMKEKGIKVREALAKKPLPVRWLVYYGIVVLILLFSYPGATQGFLYANF
ncbi:MAG: MBOAT family O-acyltransferase [Eubacteriales bacterium]|nr:MBOAT family O-acyltransferase [Eubacteriales bacterium]